MFDVYTEPAIFEVIITLFSVLMNYFLWFFPLTILKVSLSFKNIKLPLYIVYGLPALIVAFNWFGVVLNIITIIFVYLFVAIYTYFNVPKKSIKWINISTAIFILFVTATYNYFAIKVHSFSFIFFNYNDLINYDTWVRPYFDIFTPGEQLAKTSFNIMNDTLSISNRNTEHRIFSFFYVLHTIVFLVWYWIYRDVLGKHNFDFNSGAQEKDLKTK